MICLFVEGIFLFIVSFQNPFFLCLCLNIVFITVSWGCRIHRMRVRPVPPMSILDMALNHLMMKLQTWSFEECGVLLYDYYFQVHSRPGMLAGCRVQSMGSIEFFELLTACKQMTDVNGIVCVTSQYLEPFNE